MESKTGGIQIINKESIQYYFKRYDFEDFVYQITFLLLCIKSSMAIFVINLLLA